ncbi:hypothetical protein BAL199_28420 [alpha proteobacterium BAL199]|nr:hypothetical protein BAL199_28420 [alpha proteobacterium BAL199]
MLRAIAAAPTRTDPFDHAYVENVFPEAFYAELEAVFPAPGNATAAVMTRTADRWAEREGYSDRRLTIDTAALPAEQLGALPPPIRQAHRVMTHPTLAQYLIQHFASALTPVLHALLTRAGAADGAGGLDVRRSCEMIYDATGFELRPHTDGNKKLVTALIYIAGADAPETLGTHLYGIKPDVEVPAAVLKGGAYLDWDDAIDHGAVPYRRNCMLMFPRTPRSLHGVPVVEGEYPRRLIQASFLHGGIVREVPTAGPA